MSPAFRRVWFAPAVWRVDERRIGYFCWFSTVLSYFIKLCKITFVFSHANLQQGFLTVHILIVVTADFYVFRN